MSFDLPVIHSILTLRIKLIHSAAHAGATANEGVHGCRARRQFGSPQASVLRLLGDWRR
jgi:hypothetical protein